jgi:hypothetical protein
LPALSCNGSTESDGRAIEVPILQLGLLTIYLLFLYTKSDREDPSPQQLRTLSRLIRQELT